MATLTITESRPNEPISSKSVELAGYVEAVNAIILVLMIASIRGDVSITDEYVDGLREQLEALGDNPETFEITAERPMGGIVNTFTLSV